MLSLQKLIKNLLVINLCLALFSSLSFAKECASTERELKLTRRLISQLDSLGGIKKLKGVWSFAGFFGIGKTIK